MSKFRPPLPNNDHLTAFGKTDNLDSLTDAEIEARLEATSGALGRALKLSLLRFREQNLARMAAEADKNRH